MNLTLYILLAFAHKEGVDFVDGWRIAEWSVLFKRGLGKRARSNRARTRETVFLTPDLEIMGGASAVSEERSGVDLAAGLGMSPRAKDAV